MKEKKNIALIIILILAIGAVGYVIFQQRQVELGTEKESFVDIDYPQGFFELEVYDRDIPPQKLEEWENRFAQAKEQILSSPDGFNFQGVLEIGLIKKNVGDYEGARDAWEYLGKKRPKNSISFGNLGDLYANFLNDPRRAEEAYRTAIENDPQEINYYMGLSEVYRYRLPEGEKAEEVLLEGISQTDGDVTLLNYLAGYYRDKGMIEQAIEYYEKSLAKEPENEAVRRELDRLKTEKQ